MSVRRLLGASLFTAAALAVLLSTLASPALATAAGPAWMITSAAAPTSFSAGKPDAVFVTVMNIGVTPSSGPIVIRDALPPGVQGLSGGGEAYKPEKESPFSGEPVACTVEAVAVRCEYSGSLLPGGAIQIVIQVAVTQQAPSKVLNHAEVEGGGARTVKTEEPTTTPIAVNGAAAQFGVQGFSVGVFGSAGEPDLQAGSHPAAVATTITYNTVFAEGSQGQGEPEYLPVAEPKVENVDLPMGFVGDALTAPRCTAVALASESACPADTRVGVIFLSKQNLGDDPIRYLYNVTPERGYPAQFALTLFKTVVMLRPRLLPTESGYVLSVPVPAVPRSEEIQFRESSVVFFGDPSALDGGSPGEAFATNPDACTPGPLKARLEMNSWVDPTDWQSAESTMFQASPSQGVAGCGALQFNPTIQVAPETTETDTPSGYEVDLKVPQTANIEGNLATPDLKDAVVSMPEGVSLSPGAASGLVACQASGPEGIELGNHDQLANENTPEEGEELGLDGLVHAAPGHCPLASQIGEVEVTTPLLEQPLEGHLYVAEPQCGGAGQGECTPHSAEDGELFAIYLEAGSESSGIHVKLEGQVSVNPQTGQVTTRFDENPQLPFSELKLELNGGPRAPLANPQSCGSFTATSDLTPWSTPYTADAEPFSSFPVTGCNSSFAPVFTAGMSATLRAGAFSPFTLSFSRHDGEQDLSGLSVSMPLGLLGKIAGIPQCPEAQANAGTCSAASRVGTATASAGAGPDPYWQSGPVYLTGPYNGAPFGLSVVVPANAGPYHLGNIVTRAAIHINPLTAAVTVVSNPLPQMIDGIPLRIQTVNVTVGGETPFTFNPTNCAASSVNATISSTQGTSVQVSSPFAASGCAALPFKPSFTVSTQGATSKARGASLDVKIAAHEGPGVKAGEEEANVHKVDVQLPIELPSRLTTLQKACTEQQFAIDPAGCPEAAFVGTAVARTPLLPVPLEGPAILVSHAGAAFPDLDLILQGDNVVIDLTGNTDIKKGITYSKFEAAPDAPFETFELRFPEGPDSILGSYVPQGGYSLCNLKKTVTKTKTVTKRVKGHNKKVKEKVKTTEPQTLTMPTTITAQNGAVMTQDTKIAITGCPTAAARKARTAKKAGKAHGASSRQGKRRAV